MKPTIEITGIGKESPCIHVGELFGTDRKHPCGVYRNIHYPGDRDLCVLISTQSGARHLFMVDGTELTPDKAALAYYTACPELGAVIKLSGWSKEILPRV